MSPENVSAASQDHPRLITPDTPRSAADGSVRGQEPASPRRAPALVGTCGRCGSRWTSRRIAHCSGCHRSFQGVSVFDRHRSAVGERGACLDPAGLPGIRLVGDVWHGPELDADAAFGRPR